MANAATGRMPGAAALPRDLEEGGIQCGLQVCRH